MIKDTCIVWFRRDLRLNDNPAWNAAIKSGYNIIPLYIHNPDEDQKWRRGEASNWWLHHALRDLANQLNTIGLNLIVRNTHSSSKLINEIIEHISVKALYWNRCYEKRSVARDSKIKQECIDAGLIVETFNGNLLFDPLKIANKTNAPYRVFTPFWKNCLTLEIKKTSTILPQKDHSFDPIDLKSDGIDSLQLLPKIDWDKGIEAFWQPTRAGANALLKKASQKATHYSDLRDTPALDGTSRISPYLHFGQLSPAEFYHSVQQNCDEKAAAELGILRQLFWREFSAHLLYHFPKIDEHPLRDEYESFPWKYDIEMLRAWQHGKTGFPIVDAGMRQLLKTGWMHNRVRMITSSFLVKHLLQPWQEGAHWFWNTLVDADLANNTQGWQWVAGCGADASPYFRIFNPILQSKKFDSEGSYIKKWLPELAQIPAEYIHTPWEIEPLELLTYGVKLGSDYPTPIISHADGREQALDAYKSWKNTQ